MTISGVGEDVEQPDYLCDGDGSVSWYNHSKKPFLPRKNVQAFSSSNTSPDSIA